MDVFTINPGKMTLSELRSISRSHVPVKLADEATDAIEASTRMVERIITEERTVYGINTGFGLLANTKIAPENLDTLQRSIVLSHAAGIGTLMHDETVRLIMILKIHGLSC